MIDDEQGGFRAGRGHVRLCLDVVHGYVPCVCVCVCKVIKGRKSYTAAKVYIRGFGCLWRSGGPFIGAKVGTLREM